MMLACLVSYKYVYCFCSPMGIIVPLFLSESHGLDLKARLGIAIVCARFYSMFIIRALLFQP